ncbi:MAG: phosphonate ABC transporter, permease protein PhnE [Acidimicrobiales bacterium]|jgi:phosphonate transport system permease protein|nr:phosphonate ABC transporter, permease protein PhnE [Acidimicrobiales bacterium]|tara:strand:- start:1516 stop:2328 length:813 start_codon:yes stop_codon:yes gene_type:complete
MTDTAPTVWELPPKPTNRARIALIIGAIATFTTLTCLPAIGGVELDFASLVDNWRNGARLGREFLQPDLSFLPRTYGPMLETLQMAVVGAGVAAVLSVPLTLWAARQTNPRLATRQPVRFTINVVRAVPDLVYATVLVAVIGVGPLPGLITLILFDIGIVVKLVSEAIDAGEHPYMEAGMAAGGTQAQVNRGVVLAQSWPFFTNQWLYVLELNVRISAILGVVGAGGIGRLISERRAFFAYDDVGAIVLEILVVVIVIELFSNLVRRRLT